MLVSAHDAEELALFLGYINGNVSREMGLLSFRARKDRISIKTFSFTGHAEPLRLMVTVERGSIAPLAAMLRALGYRMIGSTIVK
jgi:hypothetical protein